MNKRSFFKQYLNNPMLSDEAYDCSEIADDFYDQFQSGQIMKVSAEGTAFTPIKIPEYDEIKDYIDHYVYTDGEFVYDPRYKDKPVQKEEYLAELKRINTKKINVEYE